MKYENSSKDLFKALYDDGFRFIARDGDKSGGVIRAYVIKPTRMVNQLDNAWDGKRKGQLVLQEDNIISSEILRYIRWSDEPFDIEKELGL